MGHQKKRQGNPRKARRNKNFEEGSEALLHNLVGIMKKKRRATEFGVQLKEALENHGQGHLLVSDKDYNEAIS